GVAWRLASIGAALALPWLTIAVALFYVGKNTLLAVFVYLQRRLMGESQVALSRRLMRGYLALPYSLHLRRNSAELVRNVSESAFRVFDRVLGPALAMLTEALVIIGIVAVLMWTAPWPTVFAVAVLFVSLALVLKLTRRHVGRWGHEEHRLKKETLQSVQQSFGGLKEIRVMGRERFFYERFSALQESLARVLCQFETLSALPRLIIETVFVLGMLLVLLLVTAGMGREDVLPVLGLCAYGGFRIVPSVNRIIMGWNSIRFGAPAVDQLSDDLRLFTATPEVPERAGSFSFNDRIALNGVKYVYEDASAPALDDVSLVIRRGESVAIVGSTGAGKSTLINIILGLLKPSAGTVSVDDRDLLQNLPAWRSKIGYVPQEIYLFDDTLRRNIALGREDAEIDAGRLAAAIRMAQLEEVVAALPLGLDTVVGERGVRLSGGERQRVAIARALYGDPELLVFDEATSALDNRTERELALAIDALQGGRTLVVIAHRLSTVRRCRRIVFLRRGRVDGDGDFNRLLRTSPEFRSMIALYEAEEATAPLAVGPS
ncbi:MAG TPA: ABC transporter ATP-binding protein, partial [Candidatus Binatia bacterium]|nr:ABC transporter ATP-binding protein [Candidatus Binatia bacterium]